MSIKNISAAIIKETEGAVKKALGKETKEKLHLAFPPNVKLGDLTIECFSLAREFQKSPAEIAATVKEFIFSNRLIEKIEAVGPYLNFKVKNKVLFGEVCSEIVSRKMAFGNSAAGRGERIMVEYLSPNTNKPLHLGHLRNGAIGMAVSNLLQAAGHRVLKANLINDRGIHICKSMLAWQRWANGETAGTAGMKGDHFVGKWYVRYEEEAEKNVHLAREAQEMLQKWEAGDKATIKLWKLLQAWVCEGFAETYKKFGLEFDVFYYESDTYKLGRAVVSEGLRKKVFYYDAQGAVVFTLPPKEFSKGKNGQPKRITLLRADGTSVYITQDLGTALLKKKQHELDRSIYVVAEEQTYHFRCLFKILESLGYSWANNCYHLSYGMVYLPEGKMKSRQGRVVDADDLIEEMTELASEEIKKRNIKDKHQEQIRPRAAKIAVGAIKFYLLRVNPRQAIHFVPQESISFDGFTGPYCQYAYARASGILKNSKEAKITSKRADFSLLGNEEELLLLQKLFWFPEELKSAASQINPSRLAVYIYETAKAFNQFYVQHSVLEAKNKELAAARLALVEAAGIVLKKGLRLIGIDVLKRM